MSENPADPIPPATPDAPAAKPKRRRKWRRRILIALLVVPILLVLVALLLPTILSAGPVRNLALSIAGPKIAPNGTVKIESWNFGWFGGQKINGITLFDDQNAAVAHLNVETGASLLALARGDLDLKTTSVTGDFDVRIDPVTKRMNVLHILGADAPAKDDGKPKTEKKSDPKAAEPIKVPDVKGIVTVALKGTISSTNASDKSIPFTKIEQADVRVDLNDLDRGVGLDVTIRATVDGKPTAILIKGTADAIENHVVVTDLDKLSADLTATIEQLDLAIVKIALAAAGQNDVDVAGLLKGKIVTKLAPGGGATIASDALGIDSLSLVAPQLKGDTLALKRVDVPLNISRDAKSGLITIASTGIKSDLANVDVAGTLPQATLQNLIDQKLPGETGKLVVTTDVPSFAAIAKMLPNTIALQKGVSVTGGKLSDVLTLDVLADGARVTNSLKLDAQGTSDGKRIALEPTSFDASALVPLKVETTNGVAALAPNVAGVRDLVINLAAPFGTITGGGGLTAFKIDGNLDLSRLFADAKQFVDVKETNLAGKLSFNVATSGDPTATEQAIGAKIKFDAKGLALAQAGKSLLSDDEANGEINVLYRGTATQHIVTFPQFKVASTLLAAWTAGEDVWVSLPKKDSTGPARTIGGKGEFHVRSTGLARLASMATTQPADPATQLKNGVLDATLTFGAQEGGSDYAFTTKVDLTKLTVGDLLKNESLTLTTNGTVRADTSAAKSSFAVASNFATLNGDVDARLSDPATANDPNARALTTFEMLRGLNATGNANLAKLYALGTSVSPPAVKLDPTTNQPLPPMRIEGGDLSFKMTATRDDAKQLTAVHLDVPGIDKLRISRGEYAWSPEAPITLALDAQLTTDVTKTLVAEQIKRAVASLDANVPGVLTAKTTTPIDVTNLTADNPDAKGVLAGTAKLGPLMKLISATGGTAPTAIEGNARFEQRVASAGNGISLVGKGVATDLQPTGPDAKPLPERLRTIELTNDLVTDLKAMSATIKRLDVIAPEARDAFALVATGTIRELSTNNVFDGLNAKLAYDFSQLWPLLQPFADPTGQSIGKIEPFTGKYEKTFVVSGRYPTAKADGTLIPFNDAIRDVVVSGDLQIDKMTLVDKGLDLADFSLPISLKNGIATIAFADGKSPKPFTINAGKGDFGGLAVNLAGAEPVMIDVQNKKLVDGATLNPVLSNALGKFFNPIFPNATKANAQLVLTLTTRDLHLGESLTTAKSGSAKAVLSLLNLEIANPMSEQLLGGVVNQIAKLAGSKEVDTKNLSDLRGELKDATFTLDKGVVKQNATFMLGNKDGVDEKGKPKLYAFGFAGDVRLADLKMNLDASFPIALLKDKIRGDFGEALAYAPDSFKFGLTGSTTAPKANLDGLYKVIGESVFKWQAARLIKGKDKDNGKDGDAAADNGKEKKQSDLEKVLGAILGDEKGKEGATPADKTKQADDKKDDDEPAKKKKKKKASDDK